MASSLSLQNRLEILGEAIVNASQNWRLNQGFLRWAYRKTDCDPRITPFAGDQTGLLIQCPSEDGEIIDADVVMTPEQMIRLADVVLSRVDHPLGDPASGYIGLFHEWDDWEELWMDARESAVRSVVSHC